MKKYSDWHAVRRLETEWKQFHFANSILNTILVLFALGIPLFLFRLWELVNAQMSSLLYLGPLGLLIFSLILTVNFWRIKNQNFPAVALGRNYIAVKSNLFFGYHVYQWTEIQGIEHDKKHGIVLHVENKKHPVLRPGMLPKEQEIVLAQSLSTRLNDNPIQDSIVSGNNKKQKEPKSFLQRFLRKLLIVLICFACLVIAFIALVMVDLSDNATHADLMENGRHAPYEDLKRQFPDDYSVNAEQTILNYALIRNGWLISRHCRDLLRSKSVRFQQAMKQTDALFLAYLESELRLGTAQAQERLQFLQNAELQHLTTYSCNEKAEKIANYGYDNARKWARKQEAIPYMLRQ